VNDRVLPLSGIHNFRDYGGYAVAGGGRLKRELLWRSGQHGDATPDDLEAIAKVGLATVIDLRGDSERAAAPCARHVGFDAAVLFAPGETVGGHAPHVEAAAGVTTAEDAHRAMVWLYRTMPFRPNLVATLKLYFEALATRAGPNLLHCMAGKDRTGLAAALLHKLMGVHDDDIMADYLLTNAAGNAEARVAAGAATVRANFGQGMTDDAVRVLMSVHSDYLDTAFAAIADAHGDVERYAETLLGVTPAMQAGMRERLLD
jgi:protein-tyrosine phosphatase